MRILSILDTPLTSKEIQEKLGSNNGSVRARLTNMYRSGVVVRSTFKTQYGYIYAKPEMRSSIIDKLKEIIPPSVKNALSMIASQYRIFTLNQLVETTRGSYETMEYYLDNVFARQLNWVSFGYHKSFKIYWNSKHKKEELLEEFEKRIEEIHREIKEKGTEFEAEVKELLDSYLLKLPVQIEKSETGTPSGKFFDMAYKLYLFGERQPIHLKVEIKNHIPSLNEVAFFWRKTKEFRYGSVIPIMIAPAFPSVVYKNFGDMLYLVKYESLKEYIKKPVVIGLSSNG